jgi:hypothetical protein
MPCLNSQWPQGNARPLVRIMGAANAVPFNLLLGATMKMLLCFSCRRVLPEIDFHRNKRKGRSRDRMYYCRACMKSRRAGKHHKSTERSHPPDHVLKARYIVADALRRGTLIKPESCAICGHKVARQELCGHHDDYSKPLMVRWCCKSCHGVLHSAPMSRVAVPLASLSLPH